MYLASLYPTPFLQLLDDIEDDGDEEGEGEVEGAAARGDEDDLGEPDEAPRVRLEDGLSPAPLFDAGEPDDVVVLDACRQEEVSLRAGRGRRERRRTSLGPPPSAPPLPSGPADPSSSPPDPLVPSVALAVSAPAPLPSAPPALAGSLALVVPVVPSRRKK